MRSHGKDDLLRIGFRDIGHWVVTDGDLDYRLDGDHVQADALLLREPNALYSFCVNEAVRYIGKTTRSAKRRLFGYRRPGTGQRTNLRCNARIQEALAGGAEVRVLVFAPVADLRFHEFEINLAAGLEDALIQSFDPDWNGRERGQAITEDTEREQAEEEAFAQAPAGLGKTSAGFGTAPVSLEEAAANPSAAGGLLARFAITLGATYYEQGLINPGKAASAQLGADGEPIEVLFDDGADPVIARINRTANGSGAVRVVGRNQAIARWFQRHFKLGDVVQAQVTGANQIRLLSSRG